MKRLILSIMHLIDYKRIVIGLQEFGHKIFVRGWEIQKCPISQGKHPPLPHTSLKENIDTYYIPRKSLP